MAAALASTILALGVTPVSADDVPAAGSAVTAPAAPKLTVQVLGRVKNPGNVELDAGARLSDALVKAGAYAVETLVARTLGSVIADLDCVPGGADLQYVFLTRAAAESAGSGPSFQVDVAKARQQHDVRYDPLLQQNDKIFVPECRSRRRPMLVPPIAPNVTR
ncbi:MAG TPA: SLBB domain-containing protein [Candidatus Elarobacter sp.]|jgi:protein involved in polysaccharide export with SLBB domain